MALEANALRAITERVTSIPTLPTVITRMSTLLQDPRTSAEEVGKAITNDQALASKVLKLVNSAFYGFPGRINTITHAIVILGFGTVKNIVLTASIFDSFGGKGEAGAFDVEKFWLHSIGVGAGAKAIAQLTGFRYLEEAFLGGLLHDIGKIILSQYAKPEMAKVMKVISQKNCLFLEAEKEALGATHQELGSWLCGKWNLPKDLTASVTFHHRPAGAGDHMQITSIIHLADLLVRALAIGSGGDNKIPRIDSEAWAKLGLKEQDLSQILKAVEEEVEKANVFSSIL